MRIMLEFKCGNGHISERYTNECKQEDLCPICHQMAKRVLSAPQIKLEGITGDFPSAYQSWANKHQKKT